MLFPKRIPFGSAECSQKAFLPCRPASGWAALAVAAAVLGSLTAQAQRPLGIDVSDYQGSSINWATVKSDGIVFAWTKATEGASGQYVHQASFTINENGGKAAGIYMGAYHYAHPERNTPAAEASYFWSVAGNYIKGDGLTLMPMLDIEGSAFNGNVGATSISDWINQWCTDIVQDAANAGVTVRPLIYVSACNAFHFDTSVSQWGSDIANYSGNNPATSTPWTVCTSGEKWGSGVWHFWQYTSTGTYPGIPVANVDHDVFNGTSTSLLANWVATPSASSTIYYWDPQGTAGANPYTGNMSGTWENAKWSYGSSGLSTPVGWTDGKAACFGVHTGVGTPAYTVTLNSSHVVAGFFNGALTPNSCDVTLQGSGVINLASGPQALDAHNASDGSLAFLRINCVIAGNGQLVPEGNGQSFLYGVNTVSGGMQLGWSTVPFTGTVNFNNGLSFGTGPITLTSYGTGGTLMLQGSSAVTVTNPVSAASATTNDIVGNAAGLTFSGDWSLGANLVSIGTGSTAGKQTIISGVVSGSKGLMTYHSGTLVLSGVNTYTGTTTILSPAVFTLDGAGQLGSGSYSGSIVNNGTFNYNSTATQTLSGVISGPGALKVGGSGTLVLSKANTYTGNTTVSAGTLALAAGGSIGASAVTVASGATLANASTSTAAIGKATTFSSGALGAFSATGGAPSVVGKLSVTGNLALNGNTLTLTVSGAPLALGVYRLMDCTGTLSGAADPAPVIAGTPLPAGYTAVVSTTSGAAGHVDLLVEAVPAFANLSPSQTIPYGTPTVVLSGTLSAPGPLYPAAGETVSVTINGDTQTTTINDATGDFSLVYNTAALPANPNAYPITYSYAGDASLAGASDATTSLTVTPRPVLLTGSRGYDGTATADASILSVSNPVGSDAVTVASGNATLAGPNPGPEAITSMGTLTLGGAAAANYTLSGASGSVTILPFSITGGFVDGTGSSFVMSWQSVSGLTYQVVGSTAPNAPLNTWTNVGDPVMATGSSTWVTNALTAPAEFFNVKAQPSE